MNWSCFFVFKEEMKTFIDGDLRYFSKVKTDCIRFLQLKKMMWMTFYVLLELAPENTVTTVFSFMLFISFI